MNALPPDSAASPEIGLSVLVPIYNEIGNIPALWEQISAAIDRLPYRSEVIFVNDGSRDGSAEALDALAAADSRAVVLHFRRNYGQTAALMAAIEASRGAVLIPMDGDLQNDPADIPRLLEQIDAGYDVVSGWRKQRQDAALKRKLPSMIANKLVSSLMGVRLHDFGCTMKAYRRDTLENVHLYGEMHRFIPIYAAWEGGKVTELAINHRPRGAGVSKYGLTRIIRVLLDLMVLVFLDRALDRPIQFFGKFGLVSIGLAFLSFFYALWLKYGEGVSLIQTPLPLLAGTLGLSGIVFILMGVLAEIQMRTYFESQNKRPYAIRSRSDRPPATRR
jgi:glycosyltransferase involved in cell wall biosynthesis